MLGVCSYLSGFAFRRLAACASATVMLALGLALDCRVATLLLSALRFCIASGASHTAAECCVVSLHVVHP